MGGAVRSLLMVAALALAGCSSPVKLDETPVETRTPTAVPGEGAGAGATSGAGSSSGTAPQSQVATVNLPGAAGAGGASALGRVVYFDFDSYAVRDEYRGLIEAHARVLAAQRGKRLVVEGHTDERGGREYNLALGQKRAESVAKAMTLLGANEAQIEAVSYGEERPAVEGTDEASRAKNRRAELKDR